MTSVAGVDFGTFSARPATFALLDAGAFPTIEAAEQAVCPGYTV